jgi:TolA-binding protein
MGPERRKDVRTVVSVWIRILSFACRALACVASMDRAVAVESPDQMAFAAANRSLALGSFERAASEFSEFTNRFPASPLRADAAQRAWWSQGEAAWQRKDFPGAAAAFRTSRTAFPGQPLALESAVREAAAVFRAGDTARAVALLTNPPSLFLSAQQSGQPRDVVLAGELWLTEAQLDRGELADARRWLTAAGPRATTPQDRWSIQQWRVKIEEAAKDWATAAAAAQGLRDMSTETLAPRRPEAAAWAAKLWMRAGQPDRAVTAWEENLGATIPRTLRLEAGERLAEIALGRGEVSRARDVLEGLLGKDPDTAGTARCRVLLGQALFRQYRTARTTPAAAVTAGALLAQAAGQFRQALTNQPGGLEGAAHLGLGWCLWEEGDPSRPVERWREVGAAFEAASRTLPKSVEQAVARFKAGDVSAASGDPAGALTNYLAVADGYSDITDFPSELTVMALEQSVAMAVASTNAAAGERAVKALLALAPATEAAGRSVLLVGGLELRGGSPEAGRVLMRDFVNRFPESPVRAEVELELATGRVHEGRWTNAVEELSRWLASHTNHPGAPRAEFNRAYALARSGAAGEALERFTDLANRFPDDPSAPTAQLWLAQNFFEQQDYLKAGQVCAAILTNAASLQRRTEAWYRAKLWTAEAARKLQNFDSAAEHFRELLNDRAAPPDIQTLGFFRYGEMWLERAPETGAEPLANFRLALEAFTRVLQFTNSAYLGPAMAMAANCHLQLGTITPASYERAGELYQQAASLADADVGTRAKAWLGAALVNEKRAELRGGTEAGPLRDKAAAQYLDVALGKILRPGEQLPALVMAEAARSGGELLERLGRLNEAAGLYEHAARELPSAAAIWTERARKLRATLGARPS